MLLANDPVLRRHLLTRLTPTERLIYDNFDSVVKLYRTEHVANYYDYLPTLPTVRIPNLPELTDFDAQERPRKSVLHNYIEIRLRAFCVRDTGEQRLCQHEFEERLFHHLITHANG
jgi:hypothetical protein